MLTLYPHKPTTHKLCPYAHHYWVEGYFGVWHQLCCGCGAVITVLVGD
jgi:hypothetical protein